MRRQGASVEFRNVEVEDDREPEAWPFEAILTAVERGSLADWSRLAAAVRLRPFGWCAQALDTIVSWGENPGLDALFESVIDECRADFDRRTCERFGELVRRARESHGLSLRELAPRIGTSASRLSSYERGTVAPSIALIGRLDDALGPSWRARPDSTNP